MMSNDIFMNANIMCYICKGVVVYWAGVLGWIVPDLNNQEHEVNCHFMVRKSTSYILQHFYGFCCH